MGIEQLIAKKPSLIPATFLVFALGNALALSLGNFNVSADVNFEKAFGWPAAEEMMFRLLPLVGARLAGNGPAATIGFGVASTLAFAGYHYFDDTGHFHPEFIGKNELYNIAGGALFYGIARSHGIGHSYAAHAGINASIMGVAALT